MAFRNPTKGIHHESTKTRKSFNFFVLSVFRVFVIAFCGLSNKKSPEIFLGASGFLMSSPEQTFSVHPGPFTLEVTGPGGRF